MTEERVLTVEEAASQLRIRAEAVQEWLIVGRLAGTRVGGATGAWQIKESDLKEFVRDQAGASSEEAT